MPPLADLGWVWVGGPLLFASACASPGWLLAPWLQAGLNKLCLGNSRLALLLALASPAWFWDQEGDRTGAVASAVLFGHWGWGQGVEGKAGLGAHRDCLKQGPIPWELLEGEWAGAEV